MSRRLLNSLTVLSLLLCVAVCGLWIRSYRCLDDYRRLDRTMGRLDDTAMLYGAVQLARAENVSNRDGEQGWSWETGWHAMPLKAFGAKGLSVDWQILDNRNVSVRYQLLGFRWLTGSIGPGMPMWSIRIPLWLPATAFAIFPALRLCRRVRTKHATGLCPSCGYDLRATPDHCPECGTVAGTKPDR